MKRARRKRREHARMQTLQYREGTPDARSRRVLEELGVEPAFTGEMMTCAICGRQQQSGAEVDTQWRAIDVDGQRSYFCPAEFPPDDSVAGLFTVAYERCLLFAMAHRVSKGLIELRIKGLDQPVDWTAAAWRVPS